VNVVPFVGAAVNVTISPIAKLYEHVAPQSMPAGVDVMVPLPVGVIVSSPVADGESSNTCDESCVVDASTGLVWSTFPQPTTAPIEPSNNTKSIRDMLPHHNGYPGQLPSRWETCLVYVDQLLALRHRRRH